MKAVHFGAGNIGRGFIGLMLSNAGYEVTFVARNEKKVRMLQQQKQYKVTLANEAKDTKVVNNVTAINSKNKAAVTEAIASADLITTAVGVSALKAIAESVAHGIQRRLQEGNDSPLHVIACENTIGGSSQLKRRVYQHLPQEWHEEADGVIAFPDAAVDRIVPKQEHDDPLKVLVEPYYEWIVDCSAMLDGHERIDGVSYVDKLEPYIERKLFTVNTGHCAAAYHGYLKGYDTIQEALNDDGLKCEVSNVLHETGHLLTSKYNLDENKHKEYIQRMLRRFENPRLSDDIVRVGRSPLRKLSFHDRLVSPALQAHKLGIEVPHLTLSIAAALLYDYEHDEEAVRLQRALSELGVHEVISAYMGIPLKHALHQQIVDQYSVLKGNSVAMR